MRHQQGFTLIELIAVIVILGILAAVAVPRFVNLADAAQEAAVQSIAGSLSSASALNHANNVAGDAGLAITTPNIAIRNCQAVANLLEGGLPNDYVIQPRNIPGPEGSVRADCVVAFDANRNDTFNNGADNPRATFTAYQVRLP